MPGVAGGVSVDWWEGKERERVGREGRCLGWNAPGGRRVPSRLLVKGHRVSTIEKHVEMRRFCERWRDGG